MTELLTQMLVLRQQIRDVRDIAIRHGIEAGASAALGIEAEHVPEFAAMLRLWRQAWTKVEGWDRDDEKGGL